MEKKIYITDEERAKCQKVADAFAELYEMADIVVLDVGRYGFVMLKYYTPPHGFEEDATFTDSKALFEALWQGVVRQIKRGCFRQIKTVRQEASGKHPVTLLSVYLAHWKKQQTTHAY